jgi:plasmid maintenance system antidote protein VapI
VNEKDHERVRKIVADAPPLSPEKAERLARLFGLAPNSDLHRLKVEDLPAHASGEDLDVA